MKILAESIELENSQPNKRQKLGLSRLDKIESEKFLDLQFLNIWDKEMEDNNNSKDNTMITFPLEEDVTEVTEDSSLSLDKENEQSLQLEMPPNTMVPSLDLDESPFGASGSSFLLNVNLSQLHCNENYGISSYNNDDDYVAPQLIELHFLPILEPPSLEATEEEPATTCSSLNEETTEEDFSCLTDTTADVLNNQDTGARLRHYRLAIPEIIKQQFEVSTCLETVLFYHYGDCPHLEKLKNQLGAVHNDIICKTHLDNDDSPCIRKAQRKSFCDQLSSFIGELKSLKRQNNNSNNLLYKDVKVQKLRASLDSIKRREMNKRKGNYSSVKKVDKKVDNLRHDKIVLVCKETLYEWLCAVFDYAFDVELMEKQYVRNNKKRLEYLQEIKTNVVKSF